MMNALNNFPYGTHPTRYEDVKICTYAIMKNEKQFVRRWLDSIWNGGHGSDYICVLDTGSTDDAVNEMLTYAQELNIPDDRLLINSEITSPWRFDEGRNKGFNYTPDEHSIDVFFCIDLDEIANPELWDDLRKAVFVHPAFHRIYYKYAWQMDEQKNVPAVVFWYDKIHGVKGWKWQFPVHEQLTCDKEIEKSYIDGNICLDENKIYVYHYPDDSKSRSSYLPLLKLRVEENPQDICSKYYLAREYSFVKDWLNCLQPALSAYNIHNSNQAKFYDGYLNETSAYTTLCILIGDAYWNLGNIEDSIAFYKKALTRDKTCAFAYIKLAQLYAYTPDASKSFDVLREFDANAKYTEDWRVPLWVWSKWKRTQIEADAECWATHYEKACEMFEQVLLEMSELDKSNAYSQNFFADYEFARKKANKLLDE